jgi:hypothetical protein
LDGSRNAAIILRNLAHSIRRQDWFAVVIEFLIVVAGIFVGLQVTDWNERRHLRERELIYLQRMAEDVASMGAEFQQILDYGRGRSAGAMRAFRALERCDAALATPDDFRIAFAGYQVQPTPTIIMRTYEEMVSSGALASMTDRQLSSEIAGLFGALTNYKAFVHGVRISLPVIDQTLWKYLDLSYDDTGRPVLRDFDLEAACRQRELRNTAWEIQDLMGDWEVATTRAADQLEQFADRLDSHVAAQIGHAP